jgi:hypothetical protein
MLNLATKGRGNMRATLNIPFEPLTNFIGARDSATSLRYRLSDLLKDNHEVEIDFSKSIVSQSFVDELVGRLVLQYGPDILPRLIFRGCSADVKAVIRFVIDDRAAEFLSKNSH